MVEDDVIRGVRSAREEYARRHNFNIRGMVADLQAQDAAGDWPVVTRLARFFPGADLLNEALLPAGPAVPVPEPVGSKASQPVPPDGSYNAETAC